MSRPLRAASAVVGALIIAFAGTACGSGFNNNGTPQQTAGKADLQILIGSSGTAETDAVKAARSL